MAAAVETKVVHRKPRMLGRLSGFFSCCHPQQFTDFLSLPMKAAIDAKRAQRAIFPAGINSHGLRGQVQIVGGGIGRHCRAGFQFQRRELLRGLCLHFSPFKHVDSCSG